MKSKKKTSKSIFFKVKQIKIKGIRIKFDIKINKIKCWEWHWKKNQLIKGFKTKQIAIKRIGTKYDKWKKFKEDEIKKNQFCKSFQIEQIIIKIIWMKFEGKKNWKSFENLEVHARKSRRKEGKEKLSELNQRSLCCKRRLWMKGSSKQFKR
jgi:hypothetical protein